MEVELVKYTTSNGGEEGLVVNLKGNSSVINIYAIFILSTHLYIL